MNNLSQSSIYEQMKVLENVQELLPSLKPRIKSRHAKYEFITNLDKHTPVLGVLGESGEGKSTLLNNMISNTNPDNQHLMVGCNGACSQCRAIISCDNEKGDSVTFQLIDDNIGNYIDNLTDIDFIKELLHIEKIHTTDEILNIWQTIKSDIKVPILNFLDELKNTSYEQWESKYNEIILVNEHELFIKPLIISIDYFIKDSSLLSDNKFKLCDCPGLRDKSKLRTERAVDCLKNDIDIFAIVNSKISRLKDSALIADYIENYIIPSMRKGFIRDIFIIATNTDTYYSNIKGEFKKELGKVRTKYKSKIHKKKLLDYYQRSIDDIKEALEIQIKKISEQYDIDIIPHIHFVHKYDNDDDDEDKKDIPNNIENLNNDIKKVVEKRKIIISEKFNELYNDDMLYIKNTITSNDINASEKEKITNHCNIIKDSLKENYNIFKTPIPELNYNFNEYSGYMANKLNEILTTSGHYQTFYSMISYFPYPFASSNGCTYDLNMDFVTCFNKLLYNNLFNIIKQNLSSNTLLNESQYDTEKLSIIEGLTDLNIAPNNINALIKGIRKSFEYEHIVDSNLKNFPDYLKIKYDKYLSNKKPKTPVGVIYWRRWWLMMMPTMLMMWWW